MPHSSVSSSSSSSTHSNSMSVPLSASSSTLFLSGAAPTSGAPSPGGALKKHRSHGPRPKGDIEPTAGNLPRRRMRKPVAAPETEVKVVSTARSRPILRQYSSSSSSSSSLPNGQRDNDKESSESVQLSSVFPHASQAPTSAFAGAASSLPPRTFVLRDPPPGRSSGPTSPSQAAPHPVSSPLNAPNSPRAHLSSAQQGRITAKGSLEPHISNLPRLRGVNRRGAARGSAARRLTTRSNRPESVAGTHAVLLREEEKKGKGKERDEGPRELVAGKGVYVRFAPLSVEEGQEDKERNVFGEFDRVIRIVDDHLDPEQQQRRHQREGATHEHSPPPSSSSPGSNLLTLHLALTIPEPPAQPQTTLPSSPIEIKRHHTIKDDGIPHLEPAQMLEALDFLASSPLRSFGDGQKQKVLVETSHGRAVDAVVVALGFILESSFASGGAGNVKEGEGEGGLAGTILDLLAKIHDSEDMEEHWQGVLSAEGVEWLEEVLLRRRGGGLKSMAEEVRA